MRHVLIAMLVVLAFVGGYFAGHAAGSRLAAFNAQWAAMTDGGQ